MVSTGENRAWTWIFGLTIFVSAFLLFQVQPMISKFILPWFGGGPAVWTAAMLFFQVLLLGGYAYAHGLSRLDGRKQARLHLAVLGVVLLVMALAALTRDTPITPDARWKPAPGAFPVWQVLGVLWASVGAPYFLLSTTSSLAQSWYSRIQRRAQPYAFYALSNFASLLALLSYPVLFEPNWTTRQQGAFWSAGFVVYLALAAACAWILLRCERLLPPVGAPGARGTGATARFSLASPKAGEAAAPLKSEAAPLKSEAAPPGNIVEPFAGAPGEGEAGVTARANPGFEPAGNPAPPPGAEVAPAEEEAGTAAPPTPRTALLWIALAACPSVMLLATTNQITQDIPSMPFLWVLPLSLYLLSFVLTFHDYKVNLRRVYILLALPALYLGYWSLEEGSSLSLEQMVAANAGLLLVVSLLCHGELYARRPHPRHLTAFYLMVSIGGALGGVLVNLVAPVVFNDFWEYHLGLVFTAVIAILAAFSLGGRLWRWLRWPVALGALALVGFILYTPVTWLQSSIEMTRNFYGVLRVRSTVVDGIPAHSLIHGGILHGLQARTEPNRYKPTKYYTESTGVGLAFNTHPKRVALQNLRVGAVGLGAGTIAAYGMPGDVIRFYEINPEVVRIAQDERFFTYLADSKARVEVVLGDARLEMERELAEGRPMGYDLLVIDAFSGDSIPTHLIDREAVAVYLAHLNPDGILAFHISNRHINLEPVTALLADEFGLHAVRVWATGRDWQGSAATWVLLAREEHVLASPSLQAASSPLERRPGLRVWTDEYSNLLQVLR